MKRVNIGAAIKEMVSGSDMSFAQFAQRIGIQRQNVEKTIFSKNSIDTDMLIVISEVLEYDLFQYYGDEDACNKRDYIPTNAIKEVKAHIVLEVGDEKKEQEFSFWFGKKD
jgi:hypothetical protein